MMYSVSVINLRYCNYRSIKRDQTDNVECAFILISFFVKCN